MILHIITCGLSIIIQVFLHYKVQKRGDITTNNKLLSTDIPNQQFKGFT